MIDLMIDLIQIAATDNAWSKPSSTVISVKLLLPVLRVNMFHSVLLLLLLLLLQVVSLRLTSQRTTPRQ
jgi:hypothetical protein